MIIANALNSTARIWTVFSDNTGALVDVGTRQLTIYPNNSDTPLLTNGTMSRLGTGVYYFPFDAGTVGEYTANFNFNLTGTIFSNNEHISVNGNSVNGNFEKAFGTIGRLWANYSSSSGERIDAGTMSLTIYPANSDTPSVVSSVMNRLGTGNYYYAFNYGIFANGNYTAIFNGLTGTLNYGGMQSFLITDGTYAVGQPPLGIGTIAWENGTTGTSGYIKWTPSATATGFDIYRADRPFENFVKIAGVLSTVGTYIDNTLQEQREYWYYVVGANSGGASIPSPIVNAFCYGTGWNNFNSTLQALQTNLTTNGLWIKDVGIGEAKVFPYQLPIVQLIPETNDDENKTVGVTGKKDEIYNIRIRTYYSDIASNSEESIKNLTEYQGKITQLLEAIKQFNPYWYISDVEGIEYGENAIQNKQLKFVDIMLNTKRRIIR